MREIELKSGPYEVNGVIIHKVRVKAPTGTKYLDLGEPWTVQATAQGPVLIPLDAVVREYIDHCLEVPSGCDPLVLLAQLSVADARAIRRGVLDFFETAAHERRPTGS